MGNQNILLRKYQTFYRFVLPWLYNFVICFFFNDMETTQFNPTTDIALTTYAKALAHPVRVFILRFLAQQNICFAGDISEQLPIANSTVSQHLKVLKEAGLIKGEINPPTIRYCIDAENWAKARTLFFSFFEE